MVRDFMANILKEIFIDNWAEFKVIHPGKIRKVVIEEVEKMMKCGDIKNGYLEYSCNKCGEVKKVGFRCRSRFCTSGV